MRRQSHDFDEEAKKLFAKLNLDADGARPGIYNPMDPVWRDPKSGGTIYVGNQTAAQNKAMCVRNRIWPCASVHGYLGVAESALR